MLDISYRTKTVISILTSAADLIIDLISLSSSQGVRYQGEIRTFLALGISFKSKSYNAEKEW